MRAIYNTKDISQLFGVSKATITRLARKYNLVPYITKFGSEYRFTYDEIEFLKGKLKKPNKGKLFDPEIIYVHTTWEIRESKLNFM
ncbi:MAG: hypothetical protein RLZZ605_1414 [Bacteroidota bacterium]|jgi:uncharacterized protein (UPF0216 family)